MCMIRYFDTKIEIILRIGNIISAHISAHELCVVCLISNTKGFYLGHSDLDLIHTFYVEILPNRTHLRTTFNQRSSLY